MPAALAPPDDLADALVLRGDIRDGAVLAEALDSPEVAVVHLASIVSGGAERDFDAALEVNLDGGRALVAACRAHGSAPRLVFTSSLAVFGGELALGPVDDDTRTTPMTTYGATKAMLELLFADATRKGFLDARSARPPTVVVRPGAPNAAASGFASAVVREPLAGRPTTLPVPLDVPAVVIGVDTAVACLARLLEVDSDALGSGRALNLPGLVAESQRIAASARTSSAGAMLNHKLLESRSTGARRLVLTRSSEGVNQVAIRRRAQPRPPDRDAAPRRFATARRGGYEPIEVESLVQRVSIRGTAGGGGDPAAGSCRAPRAPCRLGQRGRVRPGVPEPGGRDAFGQDAAAKVRAEANNEADAIVTGARQEAAGVVSSARRDADRSISGGQGRHVAGQGQRMIARRRWRSTGRRRSRHDCGTHRNASVAVRGDR